MPIGPRIGILLAAFLLVADAGPAIEADQSATATDADRPWAFRPPVRPKLPRVQDQNWVRNPIDQFVLALLESKHLKPSPEADRTTLIRRLYFDMTGLPPSPEEVEAFVRSPDRKAYEKLVDRLLASKAYGEHWALYWLDLVRFAESDGFKADDLRLLAWHYRDYVIDAFNDDKRYDRFIREQVAGDELYPGNVDALIATGFNRHFPDEYNAVNLEQRRQEILNDITDTNAQVFLGLTVGCARCHDHKFDPITQKDYYRFQAFYAAFQPVEFPLAGRKDLEQYQKKLRDWQQKTKDMRSRLGKLEEPYRRDFLARRKIRFPKEYQDAYDLPPEKRTPLESQLAAMVAKQVEVTSDEVGRSMKPKIKQEWQTLRKQMEQYASLKPRELPQAMAVVDVGPVAPATYLLKRGNWQNRGKELSPGFLSAFPVSGEAQPLRPAGVASTGRRSALAAWLTRPDNPLTARVMVNRLWQHHMGRGIVATPNDFGAQGEPPTHPKLLDWLACEFVERGWSLKAMHRLIVTSATYRQASMPNPAAAKIDPENRWLWRMNRRRLEGETLRDAMLAVSGQLNRKAGGPSVLPELPPELGKVRGWKVTSDPLERNRRSIYILVKRNLRYPLFAAFDAPDSTETCARRHVTTTAPQALILLNGTFTLDQARAFADRVEREAGKAPDRIVDRAYRLALGRGPDETERQRALAFLTAENGQATVVDFCHALMNLNEFLYVD
jgi:hypothetical protein